MGKIINNNVLGGMNQELEKAPDIYYPSKFWQELNSTHLQQLSQAGFENFKRSVNVRYFNWRILGIIRHQLLPVLSEFGKGNFAPLFKSNFLNPRLKGFSHITNFNVISEIIYRIYVAALGDYISRQDKLKILDRLEEPEIGNPFLVQYKNKLLSQDLCNSIHEFYSITGKIILSKHAHIGELGAGYGRLAYIFLKTLPSISYCLIDIPPALYIAQEYMSRIFPKEKIFYFRPFKSYRDIKKQFESSRIQFLMAHQIELLPDKSFDLMINVSSLHEMKREQIAVYIDHINRITNGYFYTKQWRRSRTKDNNYIKENEYPIPKNWRSIYKRRHPIQGMFFDALYKID